MKTCRDCGKPLNAGSSGGTSGLRCLICKTARGLRTLIPRRKARQLPEFVREVGTGVQGRILRRVWLVDRTTDAPAALAYVIRFHDGREKRVLSSEVELLKEHTP